MTLQKRTDKFIDEIVRRGGEIEIFSKKSSVKLSLKETSEERGKLTLLSAEGWRYYSCRFGSRFTSLAYLCGFDDNGPWAVRVPGTVQSIKEAIQWIEPKTVRDARDSGWQILRQGDVYAVGDYPDHADESAMDLPRNHSWDPIMRILHHNDAERPHKSLHIPFPCRFVAQRVYKMGRSGRRANAD